MASGRRSTTNDNDKKKHPWGNAYFVQDLGDEKQRWIELGPVWQHQDGEGLDFTLAVEPIAWRDSRVERRVVIRKRVER